MTDPLALLWPEPVRLERHAGSFQQDGADHLTVHRANSLTAGGYVLEITPNAVRARAADDVGERAARATFAQITSLAPRAGVIQSLPACTITDWPAYRTRGAMLDVSRGRIPSIAELGHIAARLAAWKYDHLQIYLEHAFAYVGHEDVWRDASPLTPSEMRSFDDVCASHGIELAPNQQSFGHFHRWLKHARYRDLAEVPEGVEHAFSLDVEPYSLDLGNPRAISLLEDLYDQLLPCFRSRTFNVGLDETFDLGRGRSKDACAARGVERVYLEHLLRVREIVTRRGHRMQFWGDVILQRPELVPELPRDLVALEWGYDAGHPFADHVSRFAAAGLEFWVCPGTSSWQSFGGRIGNALTNLREAARHGARASAAGYLTTDWGDRGHHQPHFVRDWGLFAAAGFAWKPSVDLDETRLARLLDAHVYGDEAGELGLAAMDLASTAVATGSPATNGSALFFLLAFAPDAFPHPRTPDLTHTGLERADDLAARALARIARSRCRRPDADLLTAEMRFTADVQRWCVRFGLARLDAGAGVPIEGLPKATRRTLAEDLRALEETHARVWLARDRPGGLTESLRWFRRVRARLELA